MSAPKQLGPYDHGPLCTLIPDSDLGVVTTQGDCHFGVSISLPAKHLGAVYCPHHSTCIQ